MKQYSEYTKKYVQDICDAFNNTGFVWAKGSIFQRDQITSGDFDTLTEFLHQYVIEFSDYFNFFNKKGLVNTGRCPFTGQKIDSSFPRYTYMRTRSIYFSHEGAAIWQKETDEDFEKVMGRPMPTRETKGKSGGCYIATACYGDESAPEVLALKKYRDEVLCKLFLGKVFIKFYYSVSPSVAKQLRNKKGLNNYIRRNIIDRIVKRIDNR